jgi:hypothetical protein
MLDTTTEHRPVSSLNHIISLAGTRKIVTHHVRFPKPKRLV